MSKWFIRFVPASIVLTRCCDILNDPVFDTNSCLDGTIPLLTANLSYFPLHYALCARRKPFGVRSPPLRPTRLGGARSFATLSFRLVSSSGGDDALTAANNVYLGQCRQAQQPKRCLVIAGRRR